MLFILSSNVYKYKERGKKSDSANQPSKLYLRSQESLKDLTNPGNKLKEEMAGICKNKQLWETTTAELSHCKYHYF